MGEAGVFGPDERLELISGEILVMAPMGSRHATVVGHIADCLRRVVGPDVHVREQAPLRLAFDAEPEPDVALVAGVRDDYRDAHPTTALLVVEVADSTLRFDRDEKASLYAKAGIADYWIANLVDDVLEVRRDPRPSPRAKHGWAHRSTKTIKLSGAVSPLAVPAARIKVADFLR
ncbi:Uma2 family endonuclease [bacterium]|nr:Uma2 family endonuclease [bacterium]